MKKSTEQFNLEKEQWKLVPEYLRKRGLVYQHIDSFNHFINEDIKNIMLANQKVTCDSDANWFVEYADIWVGKPDSMEPVSELAREMASVTPHECRIRDMTYSAPIYATFKYVVGKQIRAATDFCIGRIPIMLRSSNCVLANKSQSELSKMNECPHDPGGYFIVKGQEKVVLIQEQLSKNRIIVEKDKNGLATCMVHSSTHEKKTACHVVQKKGVFCLQQNALHEPVNVCILLKAMGVESEIFMYQLVGREADIISTFETTVMKCREAEVMNAKQAINYLATKIRTPMRKDFSKPRPSKREETWGWLAYTLLGHVPSEGFQLRDKAVYLGMMVRRVIQLQLGHIKKDDRDYYGNKRMELAGGMISLLFEDIFKHYNDELKRHADKMAKKRNHAAPFDISKTMQAMSNITKRLSNAISTGNWTVKRFRMERRGVTQGLTRFSFISAFGMMTRINSQFEKTRKVSGPRALHGSQWGMLCPSDTPEGEACGLVKNLALLAHITVDTPHEPIVDILIDICGIQDMESSGGLNMYGEKTFLVAVNGLYCGLTKKPKTVIRTMRSLRRKGRINQYVSICRSNPTNTINISSDGGRVCRPYIIVEKGEALVKEHHMLELLAGLRTFDRFLDDGLIEFLDVNEENDALIAMHRDDIIPETTHMEIEEFTILGACAGLIPYPDHNQSPRNTYQCAMGKQAMGTLGFNQQKRMDTIQYLLVYPQRPLVKTRTIEMINFEELPAGQNAIVAVMCYSGYDIEDAIVLNKASVDRGFGRCCVTKTMKSTIGLNAKNKDEGINGPKTEAKTGKRWGKHEILDLDGIAKPGETVVEPLVLVNKYVRPIGDDGKKEEPQDQPLTYRGPSRASIDDVLLTTSRKASGDEDLIVKVKIRETRRPELGDKFSSRHGQKGVTGLIVEEQDLPFNDHGMVPDLIMNPHGFPSRMTVGKLLEFMGSKAAALEGKFHYGTPFSGDKVEDLSAVLREHGYNYLGKDCLTSGITGDPLEAYIFQGPVYYQKLKHMVKDKMHARALGPITQLTRQPTEGRARDGGLRLGEMERDCLIGYGASQLIMERLMISSDQFEMDVCNECGLIGYNQYCGYCKSRSKVSTIKIPYACKLLFQELQAMNITPRLKLKPKFATDKRR